MDEARQAEIVSKFRQILNDFKSPYLLRLEDDGKDIQNTANLETVLRHIDRLHDIVKDLIVATAVGTDTFRNMAPDAIAVARVMEREHILDAIRLYPSLKRTLDHYLTLDLKTYPFTYTTRHVEQLEDDNIQSYQHHIISNEE